MEASTTVSTIPASRAACQYQTSLEGLRDSVKFCLNAHKAIRGLDGTKPSKDVERNIDLLKRYAGMQVEATMKQKVNKASFARTIVLVNKVAEVLSSYFETTVNDCFERFDAVYTDARNVNPGLIARSADTISLLQENLRGAIVKGSFEDVTREYCMLYRNVVNIERDAHVTLRRDFKNKKDQALVSELNDLLAEFDEAA